MGGNNSKLINSNGGDVLPAKIRPLLGQKIEEFKKRRSNVQEEDTELSKKQLLKDNDGTSHEQSSDQNEVSKETQLKKEQPTVVRAVAVEKLSQVVPLPVSGCGEKKEKEDEEQKEQKDHDGKIDKDVETKNAKVKSELSVQENIHEKHDMEDEEREEEEEDEDEDEDKDDIGRRIGPGSPSFKIYCVESDEKKEQELNDTNAGNEQILEKVDENTVVHNKSQSTDSDESEEASESENVSNPNEVVKETTSKKKGHHKRKKLEAMKKNLLNVKNLQKNRMNRMMGCAGNDRRSLIADN
ncbi:unnamed protein product [Lathyrus sativus]|nr:unnamed protein product [Lathyrus sativus]